MHLRNSLILTAALALSACASTTAQSEDATRDCFRAASVNSFGIVDDHHVRVSISPSRGYILTTSVDTGRLDWSRAIRLEGPSYICVGRPIGVYLMGGEPESAFIVTEITREPPDAPAGS